MMAEESKERIDRLDAGHRGVRSFEDLHVFARARELTKSVYDLTRENGFSRDYPLRDQIPRAAVSVMSNIAEGFERSSNAEFVQFLYIAKGSCAEVRAQLIVALDQEYADSETCRNMADICRRTGAMLSNLISYLKDASARGATRRQSSPKPRKERSDGR